MIARVTAIPGFAEPFSSISHLAGAVVCLALGRVLVRHSSNDPAHAASLAVFVAGSVLLLSLSGTYHLLNPGTQARQVLRVLDHAAIFVLIASSFTPILAIMFRGWRRWAGLAIIWAIAAVSITAIAVTWGAMPQWVSMLLYLGMGWMGVAPSLSIWRRFGFRFMAPILWGGLAYTMGAAMEFMRWPVLAPGVIQWHEVFHVAVLVGLAFHWAFAFQIADGRYSPRCELAPGNACPA